jgi:hypothetical protein
MAFLKSFDLSRYPFRPHFFGRADARLIRFRRNFPRVAVTDSGELRRAVCAKLAGRF